MPRRLRVLLALVPGEANAWPALLASAPYEVVAVDNLEDALDALMDDEFGVLLMDLNLPEALEVTQLYQFLALDRRSTPIVGLTEQPADRRFGGTLRACLPLNAGADALAALASVLQDQVDTSSDRRSPTSLVVDLDDYRQSRSIPT
jgi:CheY-like chemotaxis protein